MFSEVAVAEFADKYSDHVVFATSASSGTMLSEVWHVIPIEVAALLTAVAFVAARICVERWIRTKHAKHERQKQRRSIRHPRKRRNVTV